MASPGAAGQTQYGTKYGYANMGTKLEAMAKDLNTRGNTADYDEWTTVLLLGKDQPVCRSNCLPAMAKAGIVVQRRTA